MQWGLCEQRKGGIGQGLADLGPGNEAHQIVDDPSELGVFGSDDLNERIRLFLKPVKLLHTFMKAVSMAALISALRDLLVRPAVCRIT